MARGKGRRRTAAEIAQDASVTRRESQSAAYRVKVEGGGAVVSRGLGGMPLTLWLIVAAVVLYFYIRRANLGIDKHPGEKVTLKAKSKPSVFIGPIQPPAQFTFPNPPLPGQAGGPSIQPLSQGSGGVMQ